MVQLQLSSALDKGRNHQHKVVCIQRTEIGLYVGTMQETEDGFRGHILLPMHPLLAAPPSGRIGFLHSNRDEAYEVLALHVARAAWHGTLGFEPTCLDNCSRATKDEFVAWLIAQICDERSTTAYGKPHESAERRATAIRIKPMVTKERADLLTRERTLHQAPRSLQ